MVNQGSVVRQLLAQLLYRELQFWTALQLLFELAIGGGHSPVALQTKVLCNDLQGNSTRFLAQVHRHPARNVLGPRAACGLQDTFWGDSKMLSNKADDFLQ